MEMESIIVTKCEELIEKALSFGASDIHLVPSSHNFTILLRKYNKLYQNGDLPIDLVLRMITYFKFLSALDISEKRKPQSGSFQKDFAEAIYAFRISTLPSYKGKESLVIRILKQNATLPLHSLCFDPTAAQKIEQLIHQQQGLLLFTGATGSGKTTSLYSLVHYCCMELNRHVISLEDPVEKSNDQVLQIQVNERAGVTYSEGLRAILRHSPDVIMIGEIRDRETAEIAIQASLTGHLVLSSIHAKDTVNCLYRLIDLGISIEELRQSVIGIIAQSLIEIPELDERKAIFEILSDSHLFDAIKAVMQGDIYALNFERTLESQMYSLEGLRYAPSYK